MHVSTIIDPSPTADTLVNNGADPQRFLEAQFESTTSTSCAYGPRPAKPGHGQSSILALASFVPPGRNDRKNDVTSEDRTGPLRRIPTYDGKMPTTGQLVGLQVSTR